MITARRLPVHNGPAAWNAILPARRPNPALTDEITADFAVIGAGFAGLSAARRLTQLNPGAQVVILEAGVIAEAASGRNSGFMIDLPHELTSADYAGDVDDTALIALNRAAIAFGQEAVADFAIPPDYFDAVGKINGAATPRGHAANESYAAHLSALDEPFEMLDAQAMAEITGSTYYTSGLYTPGTVMLQPAGYVRGLAAGLKNNVSIYEQTPVTALARQSGDWLLKTPQGSVTAGAVIMATNGHLESFGFKRNRLMHVFLFATMTRELTAQDRLSLGGRPRWGITPSDPMGTTMRRIDTGQGGHRIVTRTCAQFQPNMETGPQHLARATHVMRQKFDDRFPTLRHVDMQYAWAGHLCLARNAVSVVGGLDDGMYAACCQNGLGTARGTASGIAAAELSSGATSSFTTFFARMAEPSKLPPEPIASIGANATLRWKEHLARRE